MDSSMEKRLEKVAENFMSRDTFTDQFVEIFRNNKMHCGQIISGSKSYYHQSHPTHVYIANSNICTKKHKKVWFGDIDLTTDAKQLQQISKEIGVPLYLFYEMDARWKEPDFVNDAVFKITDKDITLASLKYKSHFEERQGKWRITKEVEKRMRGE